MIEESDERFVEDLLELSSKYIGIAKEMQGNMKVVDRALSISIKAYDQAKKIKENKPVDSLMVFVSRLDEVMLRSEVWRKYIEYCDANEFFPVPKKVFFERLELFNYSFVRKTNGIVAKPPKQQHHLLAQINPADYESE